MEKVLIIAEAGVNHNGDLGLAYKMVDAAKEAGADIIKFQTTKPELITSRFAEKAEYQKVTTGSEESQLEMLSKIMLKFEEHIPLKNYCEKLGIKFLSTPFDLESISFLDELGCDIWKIPSGEVTNYPYLVKIAQTKKPIILSTGMCTIQEIHDAINVLEKNGSGQITLLHCTSEYPTPFEDVNLNAMETLKKEFGLEVGYSDHTIGTSVPIAAVAKGATVIEKHFTLDKTMVGPDHRASLEPDELKEMVNSIRQIEMALGNGVKEPAKSEIKNKAVARKSIIAARDITKGEILSEENITTKRPGDGISPMRWNEIIGTRAIRDFGEDEKIEIL